MPLPLEQGLNCVTSVYIEENQLGSIDFELLTSGSAERNAIEAYIARKYLHTHKAKISSFMPLLLSMSQKGECHAVAGLRPGFNGPMFLENYLDGRVEQYMAALFRQPMSRNSVVEIGNLAATKKGSSIILFIVLASALEMAGYHWMIFTATPEVRKLINRLNVNPLELAEADPDRLGEKAADWGNYYDNKPKVMVCNIRESMDIVRRCETLFEQLLSCEAMITRLGHYLKYYRNHSSL
jgi:hypothetical protein